MLNIEKPSILWAWVCPITGMVWDDGWGSTPDYSLRRTQNTFGKARTKTGDMRLVRVTVEPLTDEEAAAHQAEFIKWKAARAPADTEASK